MTVNYHMALSLYFPRHPLLKSHISAFWYIDEVIPYNRERILPTGTVELIINFGAPFHQYDASSGAFIQRHVSGWLAGIQTGAIVNEITGNSHMIGARFMPSGTAPFFNCAGHELHNQIVALDLLWGAQVHQMYDQLASCQDIMARFELLEAMLVERLHHIPDDLPMLHYAIRSIASAQGQTSIRALCDEIGISQKHLAARFKRTVGVTPKVLARIYRFQTVLHEINSGSLRNWADVAQHANFHDQAHFNREFTALTGMTPSDYIQYRDAFIPNIDNKHFIPIG